MVSPIDNIKKVELLKPMDLNCNIFSVYDYNANTIQELLCIFFSKINECILVSNKTIELAEWLVSQGLKIEVAKKLEEWLKDGTLSDIIDETIFKGIKPFTDNICIITPNMTIDEINTKLSQNYGTYIITNGQYIVTPDNYIKVHNDNKQIVFEPFAFIKQKDKLSGFYVMLEIRLCENITILRPNIDGQMPKGTTSEQATEWGYGIEVTASKNVKIVDPYVINTTGDGIYIGYKWEETYPLQKVTDNITIIRPYIDTVSRNGISICSGDNINIIDPTIKNIRRKFPQSAIDLEPENANPNIYHLNNVKITNLYSENCDVGIIGANSYTGVCNVTIEGHKSSKCTANLFLANWQSRGKFEYLKGVAIDTNRQGIIIGSVTEDSQTTISDFVVVKRNDPIYPSDEYASSCITMDSGDKTNLGNIIFDNIRILPKNYSYSIYTKGNTFYDNIKILNLDGLPFAPTLRIQKIRNVVCENVHTAYRTNYGELVYNSGNVAFDSYIDNGLIAPTTRIFESSLPDGEYVTGVNRVNSNTLTIEFRSPLVTLGVSSNVFTSNNDNVFMKFKKVGNDILILNKVNIV